VEKVIAGITAGNIFVPAAIGPAGSGLVSIFI
jgi:hypothetical protein